MIYLIAFNEHPYYSLQAIHNHITTHPGVRDWWHFVENLYLIETNSLKPVHINNYIRLQFPELIFIIGKVDLTENAGVLPREAWDWINKKRGYRLPLQPIKPIGTKLRSQNPFYDLTPKQRSEAIERALEVLKKAK
jgi:hypothetical protein